MKVETSRTRRVPLDKLHLDLNNPRLGAAAGGTEREVLDRIVDQFGIEDVLASIAVNGYFEAEPLVVVPMEGKSGHFRVVEGNRRLAALLVLSGDPRAAKHKRRTEAAKALRLRSGGTPILEAPVSTFSAEEELSKLMPYLGVRHIASSQPWDSYAKAAWISEVLSKRTLTVEAITEMVGDRFRTIARLVEGYNFVAQLRKKSRFDPSESLRKGRGSNPEFPFSWVYTALGFNAIREWLMLPGDASDAKAPIKPKAMDDAERLLVYLFGRKSKDTQPLIKDSREIADLARAIGDGRKRRLLAQGKSLAYVDEESLPVVDRVSTGLLSAEDALGGAWKALGGNTVSQSDAGQLVGPAQKVKQLASEIHKKIVGRAYLTDDDGGGDRNE